MFFSIGPTEPSEIHPMQFDFISGTLGQERIDWVELRNVKSGNVEATITNEHQNIPFQFRIVVNIDTRQFKIGITINYDNVDAITALKGIRISQILASGGSLRITLVSSGDSDTLQIPDDIVQPPDQAFVKFVENLCLIQSKTGKPLRLTYDEISNYHNEIIAKRVTSVLKTGVFQYKDGETLDVIFQKQEVEQIVNAGDDVGVFQYRYPFEENIVDLLSEKLDLGPGTRHIEGKWEIPVDQVKAWLETAEEDETLKVQLVDVRVYDVFTEW
jgi:hypothetical protein